MIQTTLGSEAVARFGFFTASGAGQLGDKEFAIECQGRLSRGDGRSVSIELELETILDQQPSEIETVITAPLDHPICLSVAPLGDFDSLFIIEVVEGP